MRGLHIGERHGVGGGSGSGGHQPTIYARPRGGAIVKGADSWARRRQSGPFTKTLDRLSLSEPQITLP